MCLRCDGYSEDDVLRAIDLNVRVHGFHICAVEDARPWTYTIGVLQTTGHPDLVVTDIESRQAGRLLWWIYERIDESGRLDAAELTENGIRIVPVHRAQPHDELFGTWIQHYGRDPQIGEILQVLPPPEWTCPTHRHAMTRLDRPPRTSRTGRRRR